MRTYYLLLALLISGCKTEKERIYDLQMDYALASVNHQIKMLEYRHLEYATIDNDSSEAYHDSFIQEWHIANYYDSLLRATKYPN